MDGRVGGLLTEIVHLVQAGRQLLTKSRVLPLASVLLHRLAEAPVGAGDTDPGQLLVGEPAKPGGEDSCQGDVLLFVLQHPEVIQQHANLPRLKVPFLGPCAGGDALLQEHLHEHVAPALDAPGQDDDIPIAHRPQLSCLLVRHQLLLQEPADAVRHGPCLQLSGGELFSCRLLQLLVRAAVDEEKLCLIAPALRIGGTGPEGGPVVVGDAPKLRYHDLPEEGVDAFEDLRAAPEILEQVDPLGPAVRPLPLVDPVGVKFLHKKLRPGEAEPVDALLHIPHHENVVPPLPGAGHTCQDGLLDQVAVLVLVDHHLPELLLVHPGAGGGPKPVLRLLREDAQSVLLHIRVVDHAAAPLLLLKPGGKGLSQVLKLLHHGSADCQPRKELFFCLKKILLCRKNHRLFQLIPELFHPLRLFFGHSLVPVWSQLFPGNLLRRPAVLGVGSGLPEPLHVLHIALQHLLVHVGAVRLQTEGQGLVLQADRRLHGVVHLLPDKGKEGRLPQLLACLYLAGPDAVRKPPLRVRTAPGKLVQLQDDVLQPPVALSRRIALREGQERLLSLPVLFLQEFLQHIPLQQLQLPLLADAEGRIQVNEMKILPDHRETEAVDSGDGSAVDEGGLLPQVLVKEVLLGLLFNGRAYPLLHLCRGRLREGDDEELVHGERVLLSGEHGDDALHQHSRLS